MHLILKISVPKNVSKLTKNVTAMISYEMLNVNLINVKFTGGVEQHTRIVHIVVDQVLLLIF